VSISSKLMEFYENTYDFADNFLVSACPEIENRVILFILLSRGKT